MKSFLFFLYLFFQLAISAQDCDHFALKTDITNNPSLAYAIEANPSLISAWKSCIKHTNLRTNPNFLETVNDLVNNTPKEIDHAKIEDALNGSFGDVISNASVDDLVQITDRMNMLHFNAQHLDEIIERLDNPEYLIKQDLIDNPSAFKDFDEILEDPGRFWEKYSEGDFIPGSNLEKWAQWKWFKDLSAKARKFEIYDPNLPGSGAARASFISSNGLVENKVVDQVTLEVNGVKIRIDYLGKDANGKFHLGEAKFSTKDKDWVIDWLGSATNNQKTVFPNLNGNDVVIKASDPDKLDAIYESFGIDPSSFLNGSYTIPANQIGSLKIFGSVADDFSNVKSVIQVF